MGQERKERRRVGENSGLRGFFGAGGFLAAGFLGAGSAGIERLYPLFSPALKGRSVGADADRPVGGRTGEPTVNGISARRAIGASPYRLTLQGGAFCRSAHSGPRTTTRLPWTITT